MHANQDRKSGGIGPGRPGPEACNCFALRQASRHITRFYDRFLAPCGLRTSQFSLLAKLRQFGPRTINDLAGDLAMDRTTLGRNILPLVREGLVAVEREERDRRSKRLVLTPDGLARLRAAAKGWRRAQDEFEAAFGTKRSAELRALLGAVVANDLDAIPTV
jgi:DNA-binding MarR family transcriptional regulator